MFIQNIDPVLFHIGVFEIRYYGLVFAIGFLAAYFFLKFLARKNNMGLTDDDIADYLTHIIIGVVIGARLFEVLIYESAYYLANPGQIIAVWQGGLSIHGGIVGALIGGYFFTRRKEIKKKKISFWKLADITMIPLAFGLIFGRLANFTNSEFIGRITDVPWAVKFMRADPNNFRHPVQVYEAIKNLFIFIILWLGMVVAGWSGKDKKESTARKHKDGHFFWQFIFLYSTIRFFLEYFKEWDVYTFGLSTPQLISIPLIILSAIMLYKTR